MLQKFYQQINFKVNNRRNTSKNNFQLLYLTGYYVKTTDLRNRIFYPAPCTKIKKVF